MEHPTFHEAQPEQRIPSVPSGVGPETPDPDFPETDALRQASEDARRGRERQAGLDYERIERARQAGISAGTIVMHKGVWIAAGRLTERQLTKARNETAQHLEQQAAGDD